jgi:hypothetical protein
MLQNYLFTIYLMPPYINFLAPSPTLVAPQRRNTIKTPKYQIVLSFDQVHSLENHA